MHSLGSYMYLEATNQAAGDRARLVSPAINRGGPVCVQFWYHAYGEHLGAFRLDLIYQAVGRTQQLTQTVWNISGIYHLHLILKNWNQSILIGGLLIASATPVGTVCAQMESYIDAIEPMKAFKCVCCITKNIYF